MTHARRIFALLVALILPSTLAAAPDKRSGNRIEKSMTNAQLDKLIRKLDKDAEGSLGFWTFSVDGHQLSVITDQRANRMRIVSVVASDVETLEKERLFRLLQANFDTALDARYAIARGVLWSTFIHPLSSLTEEDFASAVRQVVGLVENYGTSYSSGALFFTGGDGAE